MSWKTFVRGRRRRFVDQADRRRRRRRVRRHARQLARRLLARLGLGRERRYISMKVWTTRGSSAFRLPAAAGHRRVEAHRLVIRALRHQRVEVVDHREDARAERDLVALEPGG
jgi:hypothetical protein